MSGHGIADHAGPLVATLIARLKADAGVRAVLGVAPRVWDRAPAEAGEPGDGGDGGRRHEREADQHPAGGGRCQQQAHHVRHVGGQE